jgi:hypothetical protein
MDFFALILIVPVYVYVATETGERTPMLKTGYQFNRITDLLNSNSASAGIFFFSDTFSQMKNARASKFHLAQDSRRGGRIFSCRRTSCSLFCKSNHDL